MPVVVDPAAPADYAAFPAELERDWLGRVCHLALHSGRPDQPQSSSL